jgi:hypothetical protein
MSDENGQQIDLDPLIALQLLRIEQVRLHLDELVSSTFEAKRARKVLDGLLRDLAALDAARNELRREPGDTVH